MKIESTNYRGWPNTLRLSSGETELLVTTDVGPRVISYRIGGRKNIFHVAENQAGASGEADWRIRGGHRLWLAPEDKVLSHHADNHPVAWRHEETADELIIESLQNDPSPIRKTLGIRLAADGSRVIVRHMAANEGKSPIRLATWGLSVMRGGGVEIIPQPPMGTHPCGLLPNRVLVLWPYTDLADSRWLRGERYWLLRQEKNLPPVKFGLAHALRWIAYVSGDLLFIKELDLVPGETYPDGGSNFETFADSDILEIESLGPLKTLRPGESTVHTECWRLFAIKDPPPLHDEAALAGWLEPFLKAS